MDKILILSMGKYPNGNAGAVRQHAFAKLYKKKGYVPIVIGLGDSTNFRVKDYEGIQYLSFKAINNNYFHRLMNLLCYKNNLKKFLKKHNDISKIMVVNIPISAFFYIKKYAKKNKIKLVHDSVEWYSPEEFSLGIFSISYFINNLYNTRWINKDFKVIAISKFLKDHFEVRGIKSVRIPVIMDIFNMKHEKNTNPKKLVIVYAGAIGKKDYLDVIIEGLSMLTFQELKKVQLRIIGIDYSNLASQPGIKSELLNKINESVNCLGRVSREVVLKNLEEADFTILMRSSTQRYAKAGFPTKIVESLATATPVICNLTSDLKDYIIESYNGIIVEKCTSDSVAMSIRKALELSEGEKKQMQINARKTAESNFDIRNYEHIDI